MTVVMHFQSKNRGSRGIRPKSCLRGSQIDCPPCNMWIISCFGLLSEGLISWIASAIVLQVQLTLKDLVQGNARCSQSCQLSDLC